MLTNCSRPRDTTTSDLEKAHNPKVAQNVSMGGDPEDSWSGVTFRKGFNELLQKEASIFEGVGVLNSQLKDYESNLPSICTGSDSTGGSGSGFPAIGEWSDDQGD